MKIGKCEICKKTGEVIEIETVYDELINCCDDCWNSDEKWTTKKLEETNKQTDSSKQIHENKSIVSLVLHELIVNRIRRFEANLYHENNARFDTSYDHAIYTLSITLGKYYNKPIHELPDFIDELIYPVVKEGYNAGHISPCVVDMFIFELSQKVSGIHVDEGLCV